MITEHGNSISVTMCTFTESVHMEIFIYQDNYLGFILIVILVASMALKEVFMSVPSSIIL